MEVSGYKIEFPVYLLAYPIGTTIRKKIKMLISNSPPIVYARKADGTDKERERNNWLFVCLTALIQRNLLAITIFTDIEDTVIKIKTTKRPIIARRMHTHIEWAIEKKKWKGIVVPGYLDWNTIYYIVRIRRLRLVKNALLKKRLALDNFAALAII